MPSLPPPVLILAGAELWRDDGHSAQATGGQALAIRGSRIKAIASEGALARRFPKARVIRLDGGTLLPGFIEGHCHVEGLGKLASQVDLRGLRRLEEALERIREWARGNPGGWIQGWGWDQNLWDSRTLPGASDLDAVTGDRPASLRRVDGHALWANGAALRAAGIDDATPDPPGGRILRDARGHATGILLDNAMELVESRIPAPAPEQREAWIRQGLKALQRLGFTSACDMGGDAITLEAYRRLAASRALPIRVFSYFDRDPRLMAQELKRPRAVRLSFFQVQGVKFYFDGALGSRGARMLAPYADAPGTRGLWVAEPRSIGKDAAMVLRAGYQPAVHSIGDAANRAALEVLARAHRPGDALLPRVEHAQIVDPKDALGFGKAGLAASVQPMHMADDHAWTPVRLGPERMDRAFPWRHFLQGGSPLVFGSDAPIADANPFAAMAAAETRQDASGDPPEGFQPAHRLTRTETLRAYTEASGRVLGHRDLGVIRRGAVADLLWVQAPVTALRPEELRLLKPGRMWVDGREISLGSETR